MWIRLLSSVTTSGCARRRPRTLDQESLAGTDVNESFPTLLAIHAPERVLQRMAGHNTLINVYGAVLGGLFALPDKPKPENSYYSAWDTPLKFTDVTPKIAPRLPPKPSL